MLRQLLNHVANTPKMCYPYSIPHEKHGEYTLWLFNIAMVYMALIEIDGLPINSMVDLSHGYVSHNQMGGSIYFQPNPTGIFQRLGRAGDFRATGHF